MKAKEEIAADYFIKQCIRRGTTNYNNIIREARESKGTGSEQVEELLSSGGSIPYEEIQSEECNTCQSPLMFDDSQDEYYCPVCES